MKYSVARQDNWVVLRIEGELDATTASELRPAIAELLETRPNHVRVELDLLRLIDSSGVGAIIALFKRLKEYGGELQIAGLRGQPRAIFDVLRLDRALPIV